MGLVGSCVGAGACVGLGVGAGVGITGVGGYAKPLKILFGESFRLTISVKY